MDIYTMKDWERDGSLSMREGQVIDSEVFWELCECMPPHRWSNKIFQPGEPYDHDMNTGKALYQTFEHVGNYRYRYIGLRP